MTPEDIASFIHAAEGFFRVHTGEKTHCGDARIDFDAPLLRDYSGLIEVDGKAEGMVYFTADDAHLAAMLEAMEEDQPDDSLKRDLIGELAGTVVMNAREHFGAGLKVSVPQVFGPGEVPTIPDYIRYTVPMIWAEAELDMVIALTFPEQA